MTISIIIPTYNESARIEKLITFLIRNSDATITQIIISDGGSTDNTLTLAEKAGAIAVLSPGKGRANQMNYGAAHATGDLLYFVHADVYPPASFIADITNAVNNCFDLGRYRMRFDTKKWWLQINAFFTRFDFFVCYGGDQTLFITRKLFEETGGFKKNMLIM